jgi:hypothetical protein
MFPSLFEGVGDMGSVESVRKSKPPVCQWEIAGKCTMEIVIMHVQAQN